MIEFKCLNCSATLRAPTEYAGKKAKCKKCGGTLRIPVDATLYDNQLEMSLPPQSHIERIFTLAGIDDSDVASVLLKSLKESFAEGQSFSSFKRKVKELLGDKCIRNAQLEFLFRNHFMSEFAQKLVRKLNQPIVDTLFPYARIVPVGDARTSSEHSSLGSLGLNGTGIFRRDDPAWGKFQPPWGLTCRCCKLFLTIEAASRHGVSEAQEWQRSGHPPTSPSWVSMPPFDSELTPCEVIGVRGEIPYLMSHLESSPEWIVGLLGEIGPDAGVAIAELTDLLQRHGDVEVQLATVTALWRIENRVDRVLPAILDLLKNNDPEVRCETLHILGQMRPVAGKALPAILQAFSDTDSYVRSEAMSLVTSLTVPPRDAVGEKKDIYGFQAFETSLKNLLAKSDVVPRLLLILRDESKVERSEVAKLLALLAPNNPEVLDGLIAALKDRTSNVRASAVVSMGQMGVAAKAAVPELTLMLQDRSKHVREAAAKSLKQIDELP